MHAVGSNAHVLRKEIQAHVLAIQYQFHSSHARCPTQLKRFADIEPCRHLEKSQIVVGAGLKAPMTIVGHAKHFLLDVEFYLVGFLVKAAPCPVPPSFDSTGYRLFGATQRMVLRIHGVNVEGHRHLRLSIINRRAVRVDIHDRQRTAYPCFAAVRHGQREGGKKNTYYQRNPSHNLHVGVVILRLTGHFLAQPFRFFEWFVFVT